MWRIYLKKKKSVSKDKNKLSLASSTWMYWAKAKRFFRALGWSVGGGWEGRTWPGQESSSRGFGTMKSENQKQLFYAWWQCCENKLHVWHTCRFGSCFLRIQGTGQHLSENVLAGLARNCIRASNWGGGVGFSALTGALGRRQGRIPSPLLHALLSRFSASVTLILLVFCLFLL